MIKKFVFLVSLTLIVLTLVSCSTNTSNEKTNTGNTQTVAKNNNVSASSNNSNISNDESYELAKESYSGNDKIIKIFYPQIMDYKDAMKQGKLNELIKQEVLKDFKDLNNKDIIYTAYEIDYNIKLKTDKVLSVQYNRYKNFKNSAHPDQWVLATNIDIKKGILIKLTDIINVDNSFVKLFKAGKFKSISQTYQKGYFDSYSDSDLIETFKQAEFYLTKDSLGISVGVPYAMGNHVEFEAKYEDIKDVLKIDNEILKDLLNKN